MTLNDESFVECAKALAKRIADYEGSDAEKVEYAFGLATCREPTKAERKRLLAVREQTADQDDPWGQVAIVLLNLDEVLTK